MTTKAEKQLYDKLASIGCILCIHLGYGEGNPAHIHHIRRSGKRSLAPVIPLNITLEIPVFTSWDAKDLKGNMAHLKNYYIHKQCQLLEQLHEAE